MERGGQARLTLATRCVRLCQRAAHPHTIVKFDDDVAEDDDGESDDAGEQSSSGCAVPRSDPLAPGTMLFKTGRGTMVPSEDSEGYDSGTFMQYFRTAKPGGEGKGGEPGSGGGSEGALQRFGPKAGSAAPTEDSEWWAGTMKLAHSVRGRGLHAPPPCPVASLRASHPNTLSLAGAGLHHGGVGTAAQGAGRPVPARRPGPP